MTRSAHGHIAEDTVRINVDGTASAGFTLNQDPKAASP